ncbi:hypothetical protein Hamer_G015079, partial [Homarus americanus]
METKITTRRVEKGNNNSNSQQRRKEKAKNYRPILWAFMCDKLIRNLSEDWKNMTDKNEAFDVIYLDYKRGFDSVLHH